MYWEKVDTQAHQPGSDTGAFGYRSSSHWVVHVTLRHKLGWGWLNKDIILGWWSGYVVLQLIPVQTDPQSGRYSTMPVTS